MEKRIATIVEQHAQLACESIMAEFEKAEEFTSIPEIDPQRRELFRELIIFYNEAIIKLRAMADSAAASLAEKYKRLRDFLTQRLSLRVA